MIRTVHCRRCGQTIEAFIDAAAGIPLAMSPEVIRVKAQAAESRHADRCPAGRSSSGAPVASRSAGVPARTSHWTVLTRMFRQVGRRVRRSAL
jgi:hypothetical protein